ncbi:MAG: SWIM zinc finger family protein, partial [Actinomycetota bacterium]|nr:SWIM zinc finger family protein [Actinomycetota bacterium]
MVPPHGLVLNVDELVAEFGPAAVSRGTRYADLGRVRDTDWDEDALELTGHCWGSEDNLYRVSAGFQRSGDDLRLEWAECSCPVGAYCKHAVALLMAASSSHPP